MRVDEEPLLRCWSELVVEELDVQIPVASKDLRAYVYMGEEEHGNNVGLSLLPEDARFTSTFREGKSYSRIMWNKGIFKIRRQTWQEIGTLPCFVFLFAPSFDDGRPAARQEIHAKGRNPRVVE